MPRSHWHNWKLLWDHSQWTWQFHSLLYMSTKMVWRLDWSWNCAKNTHFVGSGWAKKVHPLRNIFYYYFAWKRKEKTYSKKDSPEYSSWGNHKNVEPLGFRLIPSPLRLEGFDQGNVLRNDDNLNLVLWEFGRAALERAALDKEKVRRAKRFIGRWRCMLDKGGRSFGAAEQWDINPWPGITRARRHRLFIKNLTAYVLFTL